MRGETGESETSEDHLVRMTASMRMYCEDQSPAVSLECGSMKYKKTYKKDRGQGEEGLMTQFAGQGPGNDCIMLLWVRYFTIRGGRS